MKYIKLYESFNESEIHELCKRYDIRIYNINDGLVDVHGYVLLYNANLTEFPFKFGKVDSSFQCGFNKLTSLEGGPTEVGDGFSCADNKLTSLEGGPKVVGGGFNCGDNNLITLEGCPISVGGDFLCNNNPVFEIYKLFPSYESVRDSLDYNYFRGGNKINKIRLTQALLEFGLKCPKNIKGYIWE